ncbi:hypothetical protein BayCH28_27880 [Mycolicibacterium sp. CH28]|uniref:hypothetical protein n=1 Tax=Mycolicibacterium sp. CH28 TaxID=2512237 RepID=UPI001080D2FA|nr:hypothetical protein [Mycolicibacterium sp. CH28]TGD83850.1 hypothetical protein BayCH28_27880 [Mycolicibacterium sp. CH28]
MELAVSWLSGRRVVYGVAGLLIAVAPAVTVFADVAGGSAPRVLACAETDTEDSFSMDCAPSMVPDVSDNLTEAEVAEPGWNSVPGGGDSGPTPHGGGGFTGGGGGGGHGGR